MGHYLGVKYKINDSTLYVYWSLQSHTMHPLLIIYYLSISFTLQYKSTSGHYTSIWMYTQTKYLDSIRIHGLAEWPEHGLYMRSKLVAIYYITARSAQWLEISIYIWVLHQQEFFIQRQYPMLTSVIICKQCKQWNTIKKKYTECRIHALKPNVWNRSNISEYSITSTLQTTIDVTVLCQGQE